MSRWNSISCSMQPAVCAWRRRGARSYGPRRSTRSGGVLQSPGRLGGRALGEEERVHAAPDRLEQPRLAQRLPAPHEELDVPGGDIVVEGQVPGVVGAPVQGEAVGRREALRPGAGPVLGGEDEGDGLVQGRPVPRIAFLDIEAQEEGGGAGGDAVVEGGVAVVVLELLGAPGVAADGVVPAAQRPFAVEVGHVVPPAAGQLRADDGGGGALGGPVVVLVAGGVVGVEEQMAHRRGARRLEPDHGLGGLEFPPAA